MLNDNGKITITVDGEERTRMDVATAQVDRAYKMLTRYKEKLGPEGFKELFKDEIRQTADKYIALAKASDPAKAKTARAEFYVKNCRIKDYLFAYLTTKPSDESHPEHINVGITPKGAEVIEFVGNDVTPMVFLMKRGEDAGVPEQYVEDEDTDFCLKAGMFDEETGESFGMYAFHQFKQLENGDLKVSNCIIFPEKTDDTIVSGQAEHLMIEFYNWLTRASQASAPAEFKPPFPVK